MRKVVINKCYGGFSLSGAATKRYEAIKGTKVESAGQMLVRADLVLVQVVDAANGTHADLKIIEIPDDVEWEIAEDAGMEWIAEKHRTWS